MDEGASAPLISRVPLRWWYAVDVVVALLWGLYSLVLVEHEATGRVSLFLAPVVVATCSVPIAVRRRWPLAALVAVVAGDLLLQLTTPRALAGGIALVPLALLVYLVAAGRRPRTAGLALALSLATAAVMALPDFVHRGGSVLFALVLVAAFTIGYAVGMHRRYAAHLLEQERRLAAAELQAARVRVTEERLRIAREIHDVVAHSMTVVTVQAAYGKLVVADQPAQARDALEAIERTGRAGLVDLRRLLGVFRADGSTEPDDDIPWAPAPGLADLAELVERTAVAGVRVELEVLGTPVPLEPGVDLSAYRVIQEALTNVVRHAGTERARARLTFTPGGLTIEVTDEGTALCRAEGPGSGLGLVGMRERVKALGGAFDARPRPDGGFRVVAEIPLSSWAAEPAGVA